MQILIISRSAIIIHNFLDSDFSFWSAFLLKQMRPTNRNINCSSNEYFRSFSLIFSLFSLCFLFSVFPHLSIFFLVSNKNHWKNKITTTNNEKNSQKKKKILYEKIWNHTHIKYEQQNEITHAKVSNKPNNDFFLEDFFCVLILYW